MIYGTPGLIEGGNKGQRGLIGAKSQRASVYSSTWLFFSLPVFARMLSDTSEENVLSSRFKQTPTRSSLQRLTLE